MVNQFVRRRWLFVGGGGEPAQPVDHAATDSPTDPDIAVDDPDQVSLGLAVRSTHVSDLGIGPEPRPVALLFGCLIVLLLDEDSRIMIGVVFDDRLDGLVSAVCPRRDAKMHCYLVPGIVLQKRRGETFVEVRLDALAWADDGDMWYVRFGLSKNGRSSRGAPIVDEAVSPGHLKFLESLAWYRVGEHLQVNVSNRADAGYEDVPSDADLRNDLGVHEYSMTK